jgi:hypothetical protein
MKARGFWHLGDVSDEQLVASLRALLSADGRNEARVVAHLAEVEARRIHLKDSAPSLFEYCQKQLGLSDNQAYYRIAAARVAQRFPVKPKNGVRLSSDTAAAAHPSSPEQPVASREPAELLQATPAPERVDRSTSAESAEPSAAKPALSFDRSTSAEPAEPSGAKPAPEDFDRSMSNTSNGLERTSRRSGARRHVPHETLRQLVERDGLCCSYVSHDDVRCTARAFLQIEHQEPWARGGTDTFDNLRIFCFAHNQLTAERHFGKEHMAGAIAGRRHSSRCKE